MTHPSLPCLKKSSAALRSLMFCAALSLSACAAVPSGQPHPYEGYLKQNELKLPDPDDFEHCRGYGCAIRDQVSLTPREWKKITAPFQKSRDAESERKAIAQAIGIFESIVGPKTGTADDVAGTFGKVGTFQLDCVDESINTTLYLAMLEKKSLLKYHTVSSPTTRTPFTGMAQGRFWPHRSAVIYETTTNSAYAVDSWFRDNGAPADIVAITAWLYGWGPQQDKT